MCNRSFVRFDTLKRRSTYVVQNMGIVQKVGETRRRLGAAEGFEDWRPYLEALEFCLVREGSSLASVKASAMLAADIAKARSCWSVTVLLH